MHVAPSTLLKGESVRDRRGSGEQLWQKATFINGCTMHPEANGRAESGSHVTRHVKSGRQATLSTPSHSATGVVHSQLVAAAGSPLMG